MYSFQTVVKPIVNSEFYSPYSYLDVNYTLGLFFLGKHNNLDFIQSINSIVTSIIIPDWTCFDADYTIFDSSRFTQVESIEIGYYCFNKVITFQIDGLNRLKTIKIGRNSFYKAKKDDGYDKSKSFHILNCESLESIQIGEYSFCDFGGEFELKNLPQLQSIQIGTIGSKSNNLYYSSLVIRGIELILNI